MENLTLKDLAVEHDYYSSECNYYSNEAQQRYNTWADFYEKYCDADIDYNLVFRWDVYEREHSGRYYMQIIIIGQRKGKYVPIIIDYVDDKDANQIRDFMKPHMEKIKNIWEPFKF